MKTNKHLIVVSLILAFISFSCRDIIETKHPYYKSLEERYEVGRNDAGDIVKHGFYNRFHPSGKVEIEGNYLSGKCQGEWKYWYSSGKQSSIESYNENGNLEGEQVHFFETGEVRMRGKYVDGKRVGTWVAYDDQLKLVRSSRYENGMDVSFIGKWRVDNGDLMEFTPEMTFRIEWKESGQVFFGQYEIKEDPYHIELTDNGGKYQYKIKSILENEFILRDRSSFGEMIHAKRL